MNNPVYLYGLLDPRAPKDIRYIGITSQSLKKRLYSHISESKGTVKYYKATWIRKLLKEGIQPKIELLDSLPTWESACESEVETIKLLKEMGYKLTNSTDGGEGILGMKHTELAKAKISATHKGKPKSKNHIKKLSDAKKGKPSWNKGKQHSEEHKEKRYKPIIDQHGIVYKSIKEAARILGFNRVGIFRVLNGKFKQTHGYTFSYYIPQQNSIKGIIE